ncbi:MAG: hypothetical protein WC389_20430, partial [Lutibacter sp.]
MNKDYPYNLKWKPYCLGSEGYIIRHEIDDIDRSKLTHTQCIERLEPILTLHGNFERQKSNASLITEAINACKSINENNPQIVAENIKPLFDAVEKYFRTQNTDDMWKIISKI